MKKAKPKLPDTLVIVRSIVEDPQRRILLLKRKPASSYNQGKWELPGGKMNPGEDIKSAIERKVFEETTLVINFNPEVYYCNSRYASENTKYQGFNYVEITTTSSYLAGSVALGIEHTKYIWVSLEAIFKYDLSLESRKALTSYVRDVDSLKRFSETRFGPIKLVVRALIKGKGGKYLILKRSPDNNFPNTWELPGGKLESLEMLNDSIKREIFEETGLIVDIIQPAIHISSNIPKTGKHMGFTYINLISSVKVTGGKLRLEDSHTRSGWYTPKEILKLNLAPYMEIPLAELLTSQER